MKTTFLLGIIILLLNIFVVAQKAEIVWKTKVGNEFGYKPHIDGNTIFILNALELRAKGQLIALNINTGKTKWKSELFEGEPIMDLTMDGENIVFCTRRVLASVNKKNGKTNWVFNNPYVMMLGSTAAVFGDIVIAANSDNEVFAYSISKNKIIWEKKISDIGTPELTKYKETVIIADFNSNYYCFDVNTGELKWHYTGQSSSSTLLIIGSKGYTGNGDRGVICLDLETGVVIWEKDIGDGNPSMGGYTYGCASKFSSKPCLADNKIIAGDYIGTIMAFNPTTGDSLWAYYYPLLNSAEIKVYDDKLILVSEHFVTLLNMDGKIYKKYKLPKSVIKNDEVNDIEIEGDKLYFTNTHGYVFKIVLKE